jgi:hypothetical protein
MEPTSKMIMQMQQDAIEPSKGFHFKSCLWRSTGYILPGLEKGLAVVADWLKIMNSEKLRCSIHLTSSDFRGTRHIKFIA